MRDGETSADTYEDEVDLLVIGAGAGGMTAALTGAIAGLSVLVCEKTGMVGGWHDVDLGGYGLDSGHRSQP